MMRNGILLLVMAWAAGPAAAQSAPSSEAWKPLFAQEAAASAVQVAAVVAQAGNNPKIIKDRILADTDYDPMDGGWRTESLPVYDGSTKYTVTFYIRVPKGYTPKKSWPLVLIGHGQHGEGRSMGAIIERFMGASADRYVLVSPTFPAGHAGITARPYQEDTYLKPLAWTCRRMHIDADRVYMTGYSQGGHFSWHLATMFGRHFAAAVPMAGIPFFEPSAITSSMYLENLSNMPLWALWGEKDQAPPPALGNVDFCRKAAARLKELQNANFTGTEIPGGVHSNSWPNGPEFLRFLEDHTRKAVPEKITWVFHLPTHSRGYYIQALTFLRPPPDFSKPLEIRSDKPLDGPTMVKMLEAQLKQNIYKMTADLDRKNNAITIKGDGIRTIRLYVTEGMFDLTKPVTIRYFQRTWTGMIPPSAKCLLTNYLPERDKTALVYNELDLTLTAPPQFRY